MENSRIEQIKTFLKENPEDAFLNYALAIEYVGLNRDDEAELIFKRLLENSPAYTATYYHYGKLLQRKALNEEALATFERGIVAAQEQMELHTLAELRTAYNELLYDEE
ncbi:MAG: hypothetical protein H6605_02325 [Flavobacteriales bacterium]|nr:hypothetical protein [Flavobacteriales bacterium]